MRFHDLIGAPYKVGGRGPVEFDCAGLVVEMQRRQARMLDIPDTPGETVADALAMRHILRAQWREIPVPERGCIVLFPTEAHVGTMLDRYRFLHTSSEAGDAHISSLNSPEWKRKQHSFHECLSYATTPSGLNKISDRLT